MIKQFLPQRTTIHDPFWTPRLEMNASRAIFHQWDQLVKTGCIENFRLVADHPEGVESISGTSGIRVTPGIRLGFFFADSDAYKWLEAAARAYVTHPSTELQSLIDDFIVLVGKAQAEDGYIYTYNQFFFPEVRWKNLQIEHELYCHGHLIEAAVSHFHATGSDTLMKIGMKAADLVVDEFSKRGPESTPGHQEIEIALIRLYQTTQKEAYLDLAEQFLNQRGRIKPFVTQILKVNKSFEQRNQQVLEATTAFLEKQPDYGARFSLPPDNISLRPPFGKLRWFLSMATGKYFQQHKPVREQTVPVGHAVRFAYLETAAAMLCQERKDEALRSTLEQAWDHMVTRRMYITAGIGALATIEGFGRDYELDPFYSYSETCASLGVIFWNWEMGQLFGEAKYADLSEWQLYNGAAVGLGQDGRSYLYNNPLSSRGGLLRQSWFKCPCCPSNISRTWADLGKYIFSSQGGDIWVQQYIGCEWAGHQGLRIRMDSRLPWEGRVQVEMLLDKPKSFTVHLRVPSWSGEARVKVNDTYWEVIPPMFQSQAKTASGYDPRESWYLPIERTWSPSDRVELEFDMPIRVRFTHPKVKATRGQAAVTRGPVVYCLESVDNPGLDLFSVNIDAQSLQPSFCDDSFDGITLIQGLTLEGSKVIFLPYYLWSNRGPSQMTVYVQTNRFDIKTKSKNLHSFSAC